jgi:hypothetical protein
MIAAPDIQFGAAINHGNAYHRKQAQWRLGRVLSPFVLPLSVSLSVRVA